MMLSKRACYLRFTAAPLLVLVALFNTTKFCLGVTESPGSTAFNFETHIRPILREHCLDCHGASEELEGGLDLRLVRFMLRGGDSGPAIAPGQPAESHLLELVSSGEMPPGEHRVPQEQLAVLEQWIAGGAPTLREEPESIGPGVPLSVEDRSYWAYQPLAPQAIPECAGIEPERLRTPVDRWLQAAMPPGLTFSPDAPRETLILRAYFVLLGLPPTAEEIEHWLSVEGEEWFAKLIDQLLESPHYGERWGRHWLDVAGYADSDGYTEADADRPWAWKYRDYVIRSLNADKPFDRFIHEQLAGDELAGPQQGDWTAEQIELLTATGFMRTAADGTGSGDNSPEARNKVVNDSLKIVGTALLGSSLHCAQCHDHRYDPISQLDFTAIRSVFEPALDWQNWQIPGARMVSLYTAAERQRAAEIEAQAQEIAKEKAAKQAEYMLQALNQELEKFAEPLRAELRTAYETEAGQRTEPQQALLASHPSVNISPGVLYQYLPKAAEELKQFDERIATVRNQKTPEQFVRVLTEPTGHAPQAKLFYRGEYQQPKQDVAPGALTVVLPEGAAVSFPTDDPDLPTSGRRLAFAKWLTSAANPLTPRVIANRIWLHHFGQGIVASPGEFGKLGGQPTHPELLDWLAADFVANGWSLKQLHRTLMLSTAWRQQSTFDAAKGTIDRDNRWLWRKPLQRLDAEIIRDRMLFAVGRLQGDAFGPPVEISKDETGQIIVDGSQTRRSLYIRAKRTQPVAMLQAFDAPVMDINCEYRPVSTVATQSLILLNGEFCLEQAGHLAERARREAAVIPTHLLEGLPELPSPTPSPWSYGTGHIDPEHQRVVDWAPFAYGSGSSWQGAASVPAETTGWSLLTASGGHPGNPRFAAIRRWTAPECGVVQLRSKLGHASEHGDGVQGSVVSSRLGIIQQWRIKQGEVETHCAGIEVQAGETLDFVLDCIDHETSDSFSWPIALTLTVSDGRDLPFDAAAEFRGPALSTAEWVAQVTRAWELALCRRPTASELQLTLRFADTQLQELRADAAGLGAGRSPEQQALVNVCHMLFNTNEFLYVD